MTESLPWDAANTAMAEHEAKSSPGPGRHLEFAVNLNNREPLFVPTYDVPKLLDLATLAEERGFDGVFVGDSLFSKPRYEAIALLGAISQRTSRVRLGTAALVASLRDPLFLALEWTTLDVLSGGRMVMGAAAGNDEVGVRREFEALGLDFRRRGSRLEEVLHVMRELWRTGSVTFHGRFFDYADVAFNSGTETVPLRPVQAAPPVWVVSNPRILGDVPEARIRTGCERVIRYGDGWLTCCRAQHPEEVEEQVAWLRRTAEELGVDFDRYELAYQVTMCLGDTEDRARESIERYIGSYYPELSRMMDIANWGPVGSPETVRRWIERFAAAGIDRFVCRFAAEDQFDQMERLARDVLPAFGR